MVFARKAAWLAALLAVATIEATGGPHQPAEQDFDDRPNILLIVLDDAGFGDVGSYWNITKRSNTPNIDALAEEGLSFTNFYAGASICTPRFARLCTPKISSWTPN